MANGPSLANMQALDEALREVIAAARNEQEQEQEQGQEQEPSHIAQAQPDALDESNAFQDSVDIVQRAAKTIDQLIERNRAVTDAAVRSVEHFRQEAAHAQAEAEHLRAEMQALREENEALKAASLAHAEELEAELAYKNQEIAAARAWIESIRSHIEDLLGNAQARLDEAAPEHLFSKE